MAVIEVILGLLLFFVGLRMVWKEVRPYERGFLPNILCGLGLFAAADGIGKLLGWS